MSKNTDWDSPAQRYHGKRVTADRRRQLGMGLIDSYQLSLELCLPLFSGGEGRALTVWHLDLYATFLVNSPPQQLDRRGAAMFGLHCQLLRFYDKLHIFFVVTVITFH